MQYTVLSGVVAPGASATKSLVGVKTTAAVKLVVLEFGVTFDASFTTNVRIQLAQTDGTGGSSATLNQVRSETVTATATGQTFGTEPTTVTPIKEWYVGSNGIVLQTPLGREETIQPGTTHGLVLRVLTPSGFAANVLAYLEILQGDS